MVRHTRDVLKQACHGGVRTLVHISSAVVYGAWPDNPIPLPEDAPLRPNTGFAFAIAHAEAERLVAERIPDVAIVDINLRGGELAYDLIDKLSGLAVRIVVMSGYSAMRLHQDKVAAVLHKPITEADLLAAVQRPKEPS